ncbi:MAG: hypothetical protein HRU15_10795 [Planctomycetes bacterium]|nr:hypothetical protein [Planctomycetota bacterium]
MKVLLFSISLILLALSSCVRVEDQGSEHDRETFAKQMLEFRQQHILIKELAPVQEKFLSIGAVWEFNTNAKGDELEYVKIVVDDDQKFNNGDWLDVRDNDGDLIVSVQVRSGRRLGGLITCKPDLSTWKTPEKLVDVGHDIYCSLYLKDSFGRPLAYNNDYLNFPEDKTLPILEKGPMYEVTILVNDYESLSRVIEIGREEYQSEKKRALFAMCKGAYLYFCVEKKISITDSDGTLYLSKGLIRKKYKRGNE